MSWYDLIMGLKASGANEDMKVLTLISDAGKEPVEESYGKIHLDLNVVNLSQMLKRLLMDTYQT